jgi:hypothetical protein
VSYENGLSSAIFDLRDVREQVIRLGFDKNPKDNDGSEITIKDCLDDAIDFLEGLEAWA